jgi:hypothetical protein
MDGATISINLPVRRKKKPAPLAKDRARLVRKAFAPALWATRRAPADFPHHAGA